MSTQSAIAVPEGSTVEERGIFRRHVGVVVRGFLGRMQFLETISELLP